MMSKDVTQSSSRQKGGVGRRGGCHIPSYICALALTCMFLGVEGASYIAPALASTIVNRDSKEHKLTTIRGSTRKSFTLAPGGQVSDVCAEGCIIRLNDDVAADYILEGNELVSVEDGLMYFENELGNPISDQGPHDKAETAPKKEIQKGP